MKIISRSAALTALFLLILGIMAASAWAGTYYVATNGSDSNSGSQSSPWKTIQKAVNSVSAGDTVYVRGGTYRERVYLAGTNGSEGDSGNASAGPIVYSGYPGEEVIMDGSGFSTGSAFYSGKWGPGRKAMSYITIKNFTIRNYPYFGIGFECDTPNDFTVAHGSSNITVENNKVSGCTLNGILFEGGDQDVGGTSRNIIVRGNECFENGDHGIKFTGDYPGVYNGIHITDSIIENNITHHNGDNDDHDGIGIHISTGNYGIIVRGNVSYSNRRQGIAAHEAWDCTYENNIVYNNGIGPETNQEDGIIIWSSKNMTLRGNTVYGNMGYGIAFSSAMSGDSGSKVESNLVYDNGDGGISMYNVGSAKVYNNTVAYNPNWGIRVDKVTSASVVKNNILYQNGGGQISDNGKNTFDYNIFYPSTTLSRRGSNDKIVDPKFVNVGSRNFELASGSPAIDAGDPSVAPIAMDGVSRPVGSRPDIGAYEMGGSGSAAIQPPQRVRIVQ